MAGEIKITAPFDKKTVKSLKVGQRVLLSGEIYTARDAAHEKLSLMIEKNEKLPFEISGSVIYYCGACPAKPGEVIGSAGPTTSGRMDKYTPSLLHLGLLGMIGKGKRDENVKKAIKECGAVYLGAIGGAGALIAGCIKKSEAVAFDELGCEALRRLWVEDFPLTVLIDSEGNDLYEMRPKF